MKKILLTLLVMNVAGLFAQQSKWQLGVNFSPDYNNIWLKHTDQDSWQKAYHDAYRGSLSFSTGFLVNRNIGKRWFIEAGLTYIQQKEIQKDFYYSFPGRMYITVQRDYNLTSNRTNHFAAIPLSALYFVSKGKTRFFAQFGAMPLFYMASNGDFEVNYFTGETSKGHLNYSTDRVSVEYIQSIIGFGLSQQLGNKFELRVTPTYRHYFSTGSRPWDFTYPVQYAVGLNLSAFIKL